MTSGSRRRPCLLALADRHPADLAHGRDLRVYYLLRELARVFDPVLVDLSDEGTGEAEADLTFLRAVHRLPPKPAGRSNPLRWLRLSNAGFPQRAYPDYYAMLARTVAAIVRAEMPVAVLNFSSFAGELAAGIGIPAVLDTADSATLAIRRALDAGIGRESLRARAVARLHLRRAAGRERSLVRAFAAVTTISRQEKENLLAVSGVPPGHINVIPNGVAPGALATTNGGPRRRSVVFWGNLDFPPNRTAVQFFFDRVFLPYLAKQGIEYHLMGRGGEDSLQRLFEHPLVRRHGFVKDLFAALPGHGAMVNAMVQGGGMKNKVLEAFAVRVPVVSTTLGLDGIDVRDGWHCLVADTPKRIAEQTLRLIDDEALARRLSVAGRELVESRYTWGHAGAAMLDVLAGVAGISTDERTTGQGESRSVRLEGDPVRADA